MNGIGDFLKRYLNFTPPEQALARAVAQVLEEVFQEPFTEKTVSIKNGTAFVSVDTILKSEIVFQKTKILARVRELVGGQITDIK